MKKSIFALFLMCAVAVFMVSCASDTAGDAAEAGANAVTNAAGAAANAAGAAANAAGAAAKNVADAAANAVPTGPTTVMEFSETEFDFGVVDEGEKVSHTYAFKNTGKEPLIISNAKGSCGCTVPKWPKEPIAPGASGEITVEFNSKNKKGKRNQKVTLTANTEPAQTFIYLKGEVTPDPNAPAKPAAGAAQPQIKVNQ